MRRTALSLSGAVLITVLAAHAAGAAHVPWEQRPTYQKVWFWSVAAVANVTPIVSAIYAPNCLPGYIVCKLAAATFNVFAGGEQLLMSGGSDMKQTTGIFSRGLNGDWYLTGRDIAGDHSPEPYPAPAPSRGGPGPGRSGGFEPPPL
jgi:hypothetical protein